MKRASVIAIERFPTKTLLDEAGITSTGNLSTFDSISLAADKVRWAGGWSEARTAYRPPL